MKLRHLPTIAVTAIASNASYAAQYLTVEQAQRVMFPDASVFKDSSLKLSTEQMRQIEKLSGLSARSVNWRVFSAFRADTLLGYVILDDVVGKSELISYAVAINPDASIKQVEILTYRESHGFEIKNLAWRKQFVGKSAQGGGLAIGDGVANISGATLSCTHVTDGVRRIAAIAQVVLK